MKIIKRILMILFNLLLLYLIISTFKNYHQEYYDSKDSYIFSQGNAPEEIRSEILSQLYSFQEGYAKRDTSLVKSFMKQLFSQENTLILGTMPNEIYIGYTETADLIRNDWNSWGDCTFLIDKSHISAHGETAWISTIGYVKFDICKLLVLPLRLTSVLVSENGTWKFQQMQFQFDLDLRPNLVSIILLTIWLIINFVTLIVVIVRSLTARNKA